MAEGNLCQTRLTGHWMRELISNFGSNFIMQYNTIQLHTDFIFYRHKQYTTKNADASKSRCIFLSHFYAVTTADPSGPRSILDYVPTTPWESSGIHPIRTF